LADQQESRMPRPAAHRIRLTKTSIAALPTPARPTYIWDRDIPNFCVRLSPSGTGTYTIVALTRSGRQVKHRIGRVGQITAEQARKIAKAKLGELAAGHDLVQERNDARAAERARLAAPTLAQLADAYLSRHAQVHKRTWKGDADMIARLILPGLGASRRAAGITHADIEGLHRSLRKTPYMANRVVALCAAMFNKAITWGMTTANPAKGIKRFEEHPRERYLTPDEIARLSKALDEHPERLSANAVRLLLLCGCRRGEILGARWEEFDLDAGLWRRPHHRLKQRRDHHLPLSPAAVGVLREIKADQEARRAAAKKRGILVPHSPFVFPGGGEPGHIREVTKFWASIQRAAGLEHVRLHDLRHSFASVAVSSGMSLPMIGALLGHASVATTQRYSHLMDGALRQATTAIADRIADYAARPATVMPAKA
jgi:integrase